MYSLDPSLTVFMEIVRLEYGPNYVVTIWGIPASNPGS